MFIYFNLQYKGDQPMYQSIYGYDSHILPLTLNLLHWELVCAAIENDKHFLVPIIIIVK